MADFETGDVVRLGCVMQFRSTVDIVNVLTPRIVSGGGLAFAAAAQDFQEWTDTLYDYINAILCNDQTYEYISVSNLTQSAVWGNIAWSALTAGANTVETLPPQIALLAWGRTTIARVQPRKYLGVFTENEIVDGVFTAAARAACQNWIDYYITQNTMTNGLVLQGVAYNPTLARSTTAISATTAANPVVQRRRRVGRGS